MAEVALNLAIPRFKANENRIDLFVNGTDADTYTSSGGAIVPSIRKFLKDKDAEINVGTNSILTQANAAKTAAANSASAAATSAASINTSNFVARAGSDMSGTLRIFKTTDTTAAASAYIATGRGRPGAALISGDVMGQYRVISIDGSNNNSIVEAPIITAIVTETQSHAGNKVGWKGVASYIPDGTVGSLSAYEWSEYGILARANKKNTGFNNEYLLKTAIGWGAAGDGVTNDTADFARLETKMQGYSIDLLGKTYKVDAIPTGNRYFNGFFKHSVEGLCYIMPETVTMRAMALPRTQDLSVMFQGGGYAKDDRFGLFYARGTDPDAEQIYRCESRDGGLTFSNTLEMTQAELNAATGGTATAAQNPVHDNLIWRNRWGILIKAGNATYHRLTKPIPRYDVLRTTVSTVQGSTRIYIDWPGHGLRTGDQVAISKFSDGTKINDVAQGVANILLTNVNGVRTVTFEATNQFSIVADIAANATVTGHDMAVGVDFRDMPWAAPLYNGKTFHQNVLDAVGNDPLHPETSLSAIAVIQGHATTAGNEIIVPVAGNNKFLMATPNPQNGYQSAFIKRGQFQRTSGTLNGALTEPTITEVPGTNAIFGFLRTQYPGVEQPNFWYSPDAGATIQQSPIVMPDIPFTATTIAGKNTLTGISAANIAKLKPGMKVLTGVSAVIDDPDIQIVTVDATTFTATMSLPAKASQSNVAFVAKWGIGARSPFPCKLGDDGYIYAFGTERLTSATGDSQHRPIYLLRAKLSDAIAQGGAAFNVHVIGDVYILAQTGDKLGPVSEEASNNGRGTCTKIGSWIVYFYEEDDMADLTDFTSTTVAPQRSVANIKCIAIDTKPNGALNQFSKQGIMV